MGKRIIRNRLLNNDEAARALAVRAEFTGRRSKSAILASSNYIGPMRIADYLAWRKTEANAPLTDQLREAIRCCGKSVSAIAQASDVPQPVVQRFVSGERGITLDTAARLAKYLGLSLLPNSVQQRLS